MHLGASIDLFYTGCNLYPRKIDKLFLRGAIVCEKSRFLNKNIIPPICKSLVYVITLKPQPLDRYKGYISFENSKMFFFGSSRLIDLSKLTDWLINIINTIVATDHYHTYSLFRHFLCDRRNCYYVLCYSLFSYYAWALLQTEEKSNIIN